MAYFRGQLLVHKKTGCSWVVVDDGDEVQLQRNIVLPESEVAKKFSVVDITPGPAYSGESSARGPVSKGGT